jgi:hypothetical protein
MIPEDLKDLTEEQLAELVAAEELSVLRQKRNLLLAETDWMANSDVTMSPEWAAYRQALRDLTDTYQSVEGVEWPAKPE